VTLSDEEPIAAGGWQFDFGKSGCEKRTNFAAKRDAV